MLEYQIDAGSDSKVMPVNMFKIPFPKAAMAEVAN